MPETSKFWKFKLSVMRAQTSYRRKGWSDKKIDRERKKGKIRIRAKDVGRVRKHYVKMYYHKPTNKVVKTVFTPFKTVDIRK